MMFGRGGHRWQVAVLCLGLVSLPVINIHWPALVIAWTMWYLCTMYVLSVHPNADQPPLPIPEA